PLGPQPQDPDRSSQRANQPARYLQLASRKSGLVHLLVPGFVPVLRARAQKARANIWPGRSEIRWQEFRQLEAAPPRRGTGREPLLSVMGRDADRPSMN